MKSAVHENGVPKKTVGIMESAPIMVNFSGTNAICASAFGMVKSYVPK